MAIIELISNFYKKKLNFLSSMQFTKLRISGFKPVIFIGFIVFFSILFFSTLNFKNKINNTNKNNLTEITNSNEFSNLTNYFISKINSPYEEVSYIIKNNDTIEKILKNYNIIGADIKNISTKLKEKKLSNIYSGRKLSLIYKRLDNKSNTIVNLIYPINNTTSIEIRKIQDKYDYPKTVIVATGKNMPQRVIDVASIIKGWQLGASIQSTDDKVLKASNRQNITSSAYKKLIDFGNNSNATKTYTDLMVALPGDTKEKHFASLKWSIESNVRSIRMHQSIMLIGTDMASKLTRKKYDLKTF